jgi:hypothetical protein
MNNKPETFLYDIGTSENTKKKVNDKLNELTEEIIKLTIQNDDLKIEIIDLKEKIKISNKIKLNLGKNYKEQLTSALEEVTGIEFEDITIDTMKNLIYKKLNYYCWNKCNSVCILKEKNNKEHCSIKKFIDNLTKDV